MSSAPPVRTAVADQPVLDGMPTRLFASTPARLGTWDDCPRRYRMTYLDRPPPPKGPPWAHNSVGASVHNALAGWWRLPRARRTPAAAGDLLDTGWLRDGFRDDEQAAACRARAREQVVRYAEGLDPDDEPVGVERTVATRTAALALSGRADRLDLRPRPAGSPAGPGADPGAAPARGEVVVVDYKTGRRVPDADDARCSLALAVYAVAAARTLRRPCWQVELHHVPTGTVAVHRHTDESLHRHLARAESIAADARAATEAWHAGAVGPGDVDAVFPARPSARCGWCDYARHCPEGRAAAVLREPWAAVEPAGGP